MKQLLSLCLLAALTACHAEPDPVQAAIDAAKLEAKSDSAHAARLDSSAATYYRLGRQAEDSAALLHLQSTHVQATPSDSAALQRFFAGY